VRLGRRSSEHQLSIALSRAYATTRTLIAPSGPTRTWKPSTVVAIGFDRGERCSDGGRITRPEPSREGESWTFEVPEAED
jgi:hypothetical protein